MTEEESTLQHNASEEIPVEETHDKEEDNIQDDSKKNSNSSGEPSVVFLGTEKKTMDYSIYGVTFLGRLHQERNEHCQDYHLFSDLGDDWHLYIVSDGAGSAKASHRGAKINCEVTAHLIGKLVNKQNWKSRAELPNALEWQLEFTAVARMLRHFIEEKIETLDEPVEPKDFNATLMALLVTPMGMLAGHIGDGRMGYKDTDGIWHSMITPHKGEEQNQTIFVMNSWDKVRVPALKMSGVFVPETNVVSDVPQCVTLLSDGCENFSWNCLQMDKDTGMYRDMNTPFPGFWEPLLETIETNTRESVKDRFVAFVDRNTKACREEEDDRTMLLGLYHKTIAENDTEDTDK